MTGGWRLTCGTPPGAPMCTMGSTWGGGGGGGGIGFSTTIGIGGFIALARWLISFCIFAMISWPLATACIVSISCPIWDHTWDTSSWSASWFCWSSSMTACWCLWILYRKVSFGSRVLVGKRVDGWVFIFWKKCKWCMNFVLYVNAKLFLVNHVYSFQELLNDLLS